MRTLFLAWQNPKTRHWYPVARLTHDGSWYTFVYTKGAQACPDFYPFGRMTELGAVYRSEDLFPLFANRLLPKTRPEYRDYLRWLNLEDKENDSIATLSRSGGLRGTDSLEVFPQPVLSNTGKYELVFLSHGLRHLPEYAIERCSQLERGERLYLMFDTQNDNDNSALVLRTESPITIVGFCPRYLTKDFASLLEQSNANEVEVKVERVNPDAPLQLRLLCRFSAPWPTGFKAFSDELFTPIPDQFLIDNVARESRLQKVEARA